MNKTLEKLEIEEPIHYIYIDLDKLSGNLDTILKTLKNLPDLVFERYNNECLRYEQDNTRYSYEWKKQVRNPKEYKNFKISFETDYDNSPEIKIYGIIDESDEAYNKRLEAIRKRTKARKKSELKRKLILQKKKEEEKIAEKALYEKLKEKYENEKT